MRILILEDELPAAERLSTMLKEIMPKVVIDAVLETGDEALDYLQKNQPDLIISDIELADGLCFDVFAKNKSQIPVIFATAYNEYAIRAFEANAIDYLLKPIKRENLINALGKYEQRLGYEKPHFDYNAVASAIEEKRVQKQKRYLVRYGNKMFVVEPNAAAYFYSEQKASFMVSPEGKSYPLDESLNQIEGDLDLGRYFRINRNLIISIESIEQMHSYSKGRLKLDLQPKFHNSENTVVSAERSPTFRKWLKGEG